MFLDKNSFAETDVLEGAKSTSLMRLCIFNDRIVVNIPKLEGRMLGWLFDLEQQICSG
jgi:hypothetical protein